MDDANVLMNYFATGLQSTFSLSPAQTIVTKNAARNGKQRQGGFPEGFNLQNGGFVISCFEGDRVDKYPTFENMTRQYPVIVEYIKRLMNAATVQGAGTAPAEILEDPDVRAKRTTEINTFYVSTVAAVPNMWDVRPPKMGDTYGLTADNITILVSPVTFWCHLLNARPTG